MRNPTSVHSNYINRMSCVPALDMSFLYLSTSHPQTPFYVMFLSSSLKFLIMPHTCTEVGTCSNKKVEVSEGGSKICVGGTGPPEASLGPRDKRSFRVPCINH